MSDNRAVTIKDVKIGQRLRARRLEIGMSQERLAELIGVTFQQVQKMEKGVNRIAASRLFDIAEALGQPVSYFFEPLYQRAADAKARRSDAIASSDDVSQSLATPEGARCAAMFARLKGAAVRRRAIGVIEALAGEA